MDLKRVMNGRLDRFRSESGVSLIHVGLLLFVFMGFSMFITDLGALWLARGQAQNAADAGALAGAIARAFDDTADPPTLNGIVYQSAQSVVAKHGVVGDTPTANVTMTCPPYEPAGGRCVRVEVFRDGTNGSNMLPTFFGNVFGFTTQKIKAVATAHVGVANATDCLRPFAVPDLFTDYSPADADNPAGEFHHWKGKNPGKGDLLPNPDIYTKPTKGPPPDPGTGYSIANNYGQQITLKFGNPNGSDPIAPGWYMPIDVPRADGAPATGGARYEANIAGCNGIPVKEGDYLLTESGAKIGPTDHGIEDLFAQDPYAYWDTGSKTIKNTCAPSCGPYSPRVIALAVYDVDKWDNSYTHGDWTMCPGGGTCVQIVNFLAFFVSSIDAGGNVIGYLTREAGILTNSGGTEAVGGPSAFFYVIQLIQ
jgi:hypothetical protein